ncbi:hypothetical protein RHMOL_Rhmol13G0158200 [Rhododendron molle]|uniref:Uncharacterized protein n=1 Tax=Rhododendron molle TaxID=49168 RepID=A0ACC0L882_RHOML|nr:hypothetical protein RHMOL_Rhmol13G0158200 [Rhododendron molle]
MAYFWTGPVDWVRLGFRLRGSIGLHLRFVVFIDGLAVVRKVGKQRSAHLEHDPKMLLKDRQYVMVS